MKYILKVDAVEHELIRVLYTSGNVPSEATKERLETLLRWASEEEGEDYDIEVEPSPNFIAARRKGDIDEGFGFDSTYMDVRDAYSSVVAMARQILKRK